MTVLCARTFRAMGTGCRVVASTLSDEGGEAAIAAALDEIERCERVLSRFDPASDLSRLNAAAGSWVEVDPILTDALARALHAREETDGLYDPTILPALVSTGYDRSFEQLAALGDRAPARATEWRAGTPVEIDADRHRIRLPTRTAVDLGGIGKGYSATRAAEAMQLARPDIRGGLVDLGGDIAIRGQPPEGAVWRVGIADPHRDGAQLGVLVLRGGGVATSGRDRRRFGPDAGLHHLIDPATGLPAVPGPLTVTVIASSATVAETNATAIAIMPVERAAAYVERRPGLSALLVLHDGTLARLGNPPLEPRLVVRFVAAA